MKASETETSRTNRGPAAAADNRRAIVAAARTVFSTQGFAVPFSTIARAAGVGQGVLYRHFPTKIAVAAAVFEDDIDTMEQVAARPDTSFDDILDLVAAQSDVSAALVDALGAMHGAEETRHLGERVFALVARLIERGMAEGNLAADLSPEAGMLAVSMLAHAVADSPADSRDAAAARARRILGAGLNPRG